MSDEPEASTYAVTEEQATQPAPLPATETSTLPAFPGDDALRGRVCLVTGATRGLGKATALGLARLGGTVVLLGRDERLLAAARDDVAERSFNPNVSTLVADLASFDAIRAGARELAARHPALHVLVHNAGVNPTRRKLSDDGIDLTLAVNHLAPFLLTHELLPMLRRGATEKGARIVTVISMWGSEGTGLPSWRTSTPFS